jgi:SAM-dependent methyltransferase
MRNQDLKDKYDSVFKSGAFNFFSSNGFDESIKIASSVEWKGKSVLDIGCGEGRLAAMIASAEAKEVQGIDYSKEAIENAQSRYNLDSLQFKTGDYRSIDSKFDVVTMQGVMEHFDKPWDELKNIIDNFLSDDGIVITSSPSFLNPRGYIWMTLAKLFDVPMSLTDLHFICPFDMINFCESNEYNLEYESIDQDWGCGEKMLNDLNKRLRNALRDADMDNTKVGDLLSWMSVASKHFVRNNDTGATVVYKVTKQ